MYVIGGGVVAAVRNMLRGWGGEEEIKSEPWLL